MLENSLNSVTLGNRVITSDSKPYIIAEIGVNHEGSLDQAKRLIDLAKKGGADAAKFQSYKADTLASINSPAYWDIKKEPTKSQHELFQKYDQFGPDDYIALAKHCKNTEIDFISTPFDAEAVDFLDPIVPFFKIASADITNTPFLQKIAKKGKPVVQSTGASTLDEIHRAVEILENAGCDSITLLHCILNYPTPNECAHLGMITGLRKEFPEFVIGYSDHTLPDDSMISLVTAHLLGAVIIEKHFTYDKTLPGNDHYHAMDVNDLKRFVALINQIHISLGSDSHKKPIKTEEISRLNARRSIVIAKDIQKGQVLTEKDLTYKRPAFGISPSDWDKVVGTKTNGRLKADHVLNWSDLDL
jgi:N-acetylneuraminate synthase